MRAGSSFHQFGMFAREKSLFVSKKLLQVGLIIATTSMVVFMPLLFEIGRETQVRKMMGGQKGWCIQFGKTRPTRIDDMVVVLPDAFGLPWL